MWPDSYLKIFLLQNIEWTDQYSHVNCNGYAFANPDSQMEISEKLQGILATLPAKPGCYLMNNAEGTSLEWFTANQQEDLVPKFTP